VHPRALCHRGAALLHVLHHFLLHGLHALVSDTHKIIARKRNVMVGDAGIGQCYCTTSDSP
jgi:hypothetical protein